MITYDTQSNVGYDFDTDIEVNGSSRYPPKKLKNMIQNAIGDICTKYGYDYPEDSTRVLTIKMKNREKSCIIHSCDFAIVTNYIDGEGYGAENIPIMIKHMKNIHGANNRKGTICCQTRLIGLKRMVYGMPCRIYTLRRKIRMMIRTCIQEVFLQ